MTTLIPLVVLDVLSEDWLAEVELDLVLVASEDWLVESELDLVLVANVDETFELLDVAVLPTLLPLPAAHTNCVCPICQAPLVLKDSNKILRMAFRFAPPKELNGTVYVCTFPVTPVKVVK